MKNENVLCVPLEALKATFDMNKQYWVANETAINKLPFEFISRQTAENNFMYKQIIPYAVVQNRNGEVLCYQRHGSEKRLADIFSVGIGGHVNDKDEGTLLLNRLIVGLRREFGEEVGISLSESQFELVGMINEEQTEVGHCHTGIVFKVAVDDESFIFDAEIGNPQWKRINDLDLSRFELWSALALRLVIDSDK